MRYTKTIAERLNHNYATIVKREIFLITNASLPSDAKVLWILLRNLAWTNDANYYDPTNSYYVILRPDEIREHLLIAGELTDEWEERFLTTKKMSRSAFYKNIKILKDSGWLFQVKKKKYQVINPEDWKVQPGGFPEPIY